MKWCNGSKSSRALGDGSASTGNAENPATRNAYIPPRKNPQYSATGTARTIHETPSQMPSPSNADINPTVLRTAMTVGHAKIWRMVRYRVRAGIMATTSAA